MMPAIQSAGVSGVIRIAAAGVLIGLLVGAAILAAPPRGRYPLLDHDHDEVMVSQTAAAPTRTISVLFVGDSLTFVHDVPAMLVNIASSDPANTTRLDVKAVTWPSADLDYLRTQTGALAWAQAHHVDYVVLQEQSRWFQGGYHWALGHATAWTEALQPLGETPVLFQVWADGAASEAYTNPRYSAFGSTPERSAQDSDAATDRLGQQLGLQVAYVGRAFESARETQGAPDVYGPDGHHASMAGAYLAGLVFYQFFTGRSGAQASFRPPGVDAAAAAKLVRASAG
jgi:hypothetical protein